MKILHLSDTHGLHHELDELPFADVIIHSGDFTFGGLAQEVMDFIEWFGALPHTHKIFIAGNHDDCLYQAEIEGLPENTHYLCNSEIRIEGVSFYGIPMFMADAIHGEYDKSMNRIPLNTDILITHQPPYGIMDFSEDVHYGDEVLLSRITVVKPKYHLFGHIHNNYGTLKSKKTVFVNSAILNNDYKIANKPNLLTIK